VMKNKLAVDDNCSGDVLVNFDTDICILRRGISGSDYFQSFNCAVIYGREFQACKYPLTFADMFDSKTSQWCWVRDGFSGHTFGQLQYFFRLNFTSAFDDFPMASIRPVPFYEKENNGGQAMLYKQIGLGKTRKTIYHLTQHQYESGPFEPTSSKKDGYAFVALDALSPSRYVLARNPKNILEIAFLAVDPESTGQLGALYAVYDGGDSLVAKWKESCSGSSDDNDINTDDDDDDDDDQAEKDASEYDEEQMQDHSSRKHTTSESNYFLTNEVKTWLNNFQSSA
jgi:hypothetical protein